MKKILILIISIFITSILFGKIRTIHVFVALCDNKYQGIVPVPKSLGDGQSPKGNLYWGAAYGIKSYFKYIAKEWKLIKNVRSQNKIILERLLFKHKKKDVYMLADAYDGEKIKETIEDFLKASNGQNSMPVKYGSLNLNFGGGSYLLAYIGHDGLMDFDVNVTYKDSAKGKRGVIILACFSKKHFSSHINKARANPLLWATHLMAPEAYTLKAAIDGWILNESGKKIVERAAQAYNKYQKCGIKGARNLFTTGF